jgi:hypothetical protein
MKNWRIGEFSNFERGQIIGVRLAGASVTKTATSLGVSKLMSAYMDHGKTSAKRNGGQNSTPTERHHRTMGRILSKNCRSTAAQVKAELNIHLEDPVSTKTVRRELHKSNVYSRAAIAKPLITESNAQMRERW